MEKRRKEKNRKREDEGEDRQMYLNVLSNRHSERDFAVDGEKGHGSKQGVQ